MRASDIELYGYLESQLNALRCPSEFNETGHIHLLVHGHEDKDVIPRSLQLIAGRTGQEYNQSKKRKSLLKKSLLNRPFKNPKCKEQKKFDEKKYEPTSQRCSSQ